MKKIQCFFIAFSLFFSLFAQEALKSTEEEYYDFLSLTGAVERPTLGYRTLSDSVWNFCEITRFTENDDGTFSKICISGQSADENIWKTNNLGSVFTLKEAGGQASNAFTRGINRSIRFRIYGPEWYNSYNTAAPYGQNDGALWQGKGYNTSLTAGARLEAYGFELTVKPSLSFSQNLSFDYITPNYSGSNYEGKTATYGYYGVASIDAPQRFGDSAFWTYSWGDTEARWTWKKLTVGFGTQSIWLGPAKLNPIIHSNNAAGYPKLDIGLRKAKLTMPHFGWNLGYLESRAWWGKLSESDFFDNDISNNDNLITGFGLYYQFPFLKEFTIGLNRTMLSKWNDKNAYTLFETFIPGLGREGGSDSSDQRFSFTFDYNIKKAGFEIYFEWARNDHSPNLDYYLRYPYHTQGWTFGSRKFINLPWDLKGELHLELTYLETSADYDRLINWYTTFYSHHVVTQGYTNGGQWLGAGIGTGGNSQYLGFSVYHKKGIVTFFAQRRNPDLDYTMYIDSRKYSENYKKGIWSAEGNIRMVLDFGLSVVYYIKPSLPISAGIVFEDEHNPLNVSTTEGNGAASVHRYNFSISLGAKYIF